MSDLDDQLDRSETAILEAAYAVDRLLAKMGDYGDEDTTDVRLGPPCPQCGTPLEVDVTRHGDALLGVARGFKRCDCTAG